MPAPSDPDTDLDPDLETGVTDGTASARLRVQAPDPETIAAALAPDDTDEMTTVSTDDAVVVTIARPDAGGLRTTTDDVVRNLQVATRVLDDVVADTAVDDRDTAVYGHLDGDTGGRHTSVSDDTTDSAATADADATRDTDPDDADPDTDPDQDPESTSTSTP